MQPRLGLPISPLEWDVADAYEWRVVAEPEPESAEERAIRSKRPTVANTILSASAADTYIVPMGGMQLARPMPSRSVICV